jgi:arylsulfatase A-like enzyme
MCRVGEKIHKNLRAVLPICAIIIIWFALADSYQVIASSVKLLESIQSVALVLVYGCLATSVVLFPLFAVVSIVVTLLQARRKPEPAQHAGKVAGIVIFFLVLAFGYLAIKTSLTGTNPLDPRVGFPLLALPLFGWLLGHFIGAYIGHLYNPSNWPKLLGKHYSAATGTAVFLFGSLVAQFISLREELYKTRIYFSTAENIIIYVIFIIAGLLAWLILRLIFARLSRRGGFPVVALIAIFIIIPLIIFLRPTPPDNPDKHNPNPGNKGRNVILISIDTLRYDKLGCDGDDRIRTPNIDALAAEGVVFDNCIVPLPLTVPSHATMLTGLNPRTHGLRVQDYNLDRSFTTIAEKLSDEGFTCGGFVSVFLLKGKFTQLDQGFHYYDDYWAYIGESKLFPPEVKFFFAAKVLNKILIGRTINKRPLERKAEPSVDSAINWLDYAKNDDFFCFLHLFDPHWDYNAPEPYKNMYDPDYDESKIKFNAQLKTRIWNNEVQLNRKDIDHLVDRYDGEITYTDAQLGRFFSRLKELGLWDKSMIILTADHGESFEHDYYFDHPDRVYQSCIHVPLIIKPFGNTDGRRCEALCTNADFFPTICEALGFNAGSNLDGVSLARLLKSPFDDTFKPHQAIYSESYGFPSYNTQHYGKVYCIIMDGEKLIYSPFAYPYAPIYQYYDLAIDPGEENNLYDSRTDAADILFKQLEKWVADDKEDLRGLTGKIEMENLKSLQYLK